MPWTAALLQTCQCSHIHSASVAGTHKCCPGNNTTYPLGRSSVNSDTFYRSSSITSIVKCCTTPAICSSSNDVQCAPDPSPLSSSGVNRGSGLIETNPSSTDTDQTVLNTVNNAVQQVKLIPGATLQRKNTFLSAAVPLTHCVPNRVTRRVKSMNMWTLHSC